MSLSPPDDYQEPSPRSLKGRLLGWLQAHPEQWICVECIRPDNQSHCQVCRHLRLVGIGSSRIDGSFHALKNDYGLNAEIGKEECPSHGKKTHYRLLPGRRPTRKRIPLTEKNRSIVKALYKSRDAYLDRKTTIGEVDHREPIQRQGGSDEEALNWDDVDAVKQRYMWLTPHHNKTKRWNCKQCEKDNKRPPFMGVSYWFIGNERFEEELGCRGCGWAYPEEWRESLNEKLLGTKQTL